MFLDREYSGAKRARVLVVQTWQSEASLSVLLALLVLAIFIMPLTEFVNRHFSLYTDLCYSLLVLVGIALAWFQRRAFRVMLVVAVVSISLRCAARWYPELNTFREATMLACILATTYIVIAQVFRGGRVTSMRIQGALAIYMLFGLAWANAYELVDMSYHGIAFYTQEPMGSVSAWVYYSFVTLTTLGYGD